MDEYSYLCDGELNEDDIHAVIGWMREAGKLALATQRGIAYRLKPDATPVTQTEENIEKFFLQKIHQRFPGHVMLGEESGLAEKNSRYAWAIDPIDGTRPYLWGLPTWGVSAGLLCGGQPLAGFCYLPAMDELYWGWRGGVYLNGQPLVRTEEEPFRGPMTFVCVPSNAHRRYTIDYPRLHSLGSTVTHLALLARGVAAGVLTRRVYLWDIAAFLAILPALGIEMSYLSGRALDINALIDGSSTPEPVIAAPKRWLDDLRASIELRRDVGMG